MKNSKLLYLIAILAICSPFIKLSADANKRVGTELVEIVTRGFDEYLIATGAFAFKSETNLVLQIGSTVTNVLVEEGDHVKMGEVLLELDSFDLNNQSNILQREFNRYKVEWAIAENELKAAQRKHNFNATLVKR